MPVVQGKLTLGFRSGTILTDKNYPAFALFNEIFGGSPTSMLFNNVREKMSLCYYCSSAPDALKGVLMVISGIENSNKDKAKEAILAQLDAVKNGNFTDEELMLARKSLVNGYKEIPDSNSGLYNWYLTRMIAGLSSSPQDAADAVLAVTKEEVIEVAKKVTFEMSYFLQGTIEKSDAQEVSEDE